MSKHTFIKDGLTIVFHYYPAEVPYYGMEGAYPGSPAALDIESVILKDLSGEKDLFIALQGEAWIALMDWAEGEAWEYLREQGELSKGDPD